MHKFFLQQFSSSESSEQSTVPSQTWYLRIQTPVVAHLKSSTAKHGLSTKVRNSDACYITDFDLHDLIGLTWIP